MNLVITTILIGNLVVTSYRSVPLQTDNSPYRTSINERVNNGGVAVHPSLLCPQAKIAVKGGFQLCRRNTLGCKPEMLHYHDTLFIEQVGFKMINDVMAVKTKMGSRVDVWVESLENEKTFHKKFKNKKLRIWRVYVEK